MEQWELERLRKRYEKRLNDTLRMAPHEDNVQDGAILYANMLFGRSFQKLSR